MERPFQLYKHPPRLDKTDGQFSSLNKTTAKRFVAEYNDQERLGRSRPCKWTTVVSSSSLICHSSAFTAAIIFFGRPEPGLLSMLFISLCFCRNFCIPNQLAIKPSSCNMRQVISSLWSGEFVVPCTCCTSLAACERQKQRILLKATLLNSAPNRICRPHHDHLVSKQLFLLRSARKLKQTDKTDGLYKQFDLFI